jgi:hypothetical protein
VVFVARGGNSSALNCHGGRPFPPPHRPPRLDTCTRMLIPVLNVDKDQLGGVKVGSNNLGGGECFRSHVYSSTVLLTTPAADMLAQNSTERKLHCSSGRGPLFILFITSWYRLHRKHCFSLAAQLFFSGGLTWRSHYSAAAVVLFIISWLLPSIVYTF